MQLFVERFPQSGRGGNGVFCFIHFKYFVHGGLVLGQSRIDVRGRLFQFIGAAFEHLSGFFIPLFGICPVTRGKVHPFPVIIYIHADGNIFRDESPVLFPLFQRKAHASFYLHILSFFLHLNLHLFFDISYCFLTCMNKLFEDKILNFRLVLSYNVRCCKKEYNTGGTTINRLTNICKAVFNLAEKSF